MARQDLAVVKDPASGTLSSLECGDILVAKKPHFVYYHVLVLQLHVARKGDTESLFLDPKHTFHNLCELLLPLQ